MKYHKPPTGVCVEMTPSAFFMLGPCNFLQRFTYQAFAFTRTRDMVGTKDHPNWWLTISLDGFGGHTYSESFLCFWDHKTGVAKEEGGSSQASQKTLSMLEL